MTILDTSGKSDKVKSRSIVLLIIIMVAFGIMAYTYTTNGTFEEHSVVDDLDGLVYSFASLGQGDIDGFFEGLIDSMVVIGLFMVMFALLHFIFTLTLSHIFSKHLSTVLSVVISVYAFINHTIYNYLISLNAFAIGFFVFCAFVIMIWGFGKNSYKNLKESQHELQKAKEVAKQQYLAKGYVDGDIIRHIKNLRNEIAVNKKKYAKELAEKYNKE